MRLSTKGRYGLKAMFELALHSGEGPIPLKDIAESQNISEHYLEQLVATLRRAGYVNSVRGAQGGYLLSKEPKNITVGDVIRCLEGQIAPAECVMKDAADCNRESYCVTQTVWRKIRDSVNEVIDNTTLQDMVDDHIKNH
ncbi:MAG: Rrf2 family transcriptional regulator [Firmicutes bacterium]|nr:Rrf2 family transcriptional regulator [Bacillota bacterium]